MDTRLIQFNLSRENLPLQVQWPLRSTAPSPSTLPEIEMNTVTMTRPDIMEMSPCERQERERMFL